MVLTRLPAYLLFLLSLSLPAVAADPAPLVIFAASSLRQPFDELADLYQQRHNTQRPLLRFSGSQILRTQLEQGAAADIFVSANSEIMAPLTAQGLLETPRLFAGNRLALLVDRRCEQLHQLTDLARPGVLLVTGNQNVPVGRYSTQFWRNLAADPDFGPILTKAIQRNIVSRESSAKTLVTKLQLGEVDAALVYRSELSSALLAKVRSLELPELHNPVANYLVAISRQSQARENAVRFIDLLLSAEGQQLLSRHNFLPAMEHQYVNQ